MQPGSPPPVLNCEASPPDRLAVSHLPRCVFFLSPPSVLLSLSPVRRVHTPAAIMHRHRPAHGLSSLLPVALWIFSHASGAHGALPTTRKLLFLFVYLFGYLFIFACVSPSPEWVSVDGCGWEVDRARHRSGSRGGSRGAFTGVAAGIPAVVPAGALRSLRGQSAHESPCMASEFRPTRVNSSGSLLLCVLFCALWVIFGTGFHTGLGY